MNDPIAVRPLPKSVIVTGAAGFIGSHLTERLLVEGVRVVAIDNFDPYYPRSRKEANLASALRHPNLTFHELDIRDKDALRQAFQSSGSETVFHLAARPGVRSSVNDVDDYASLNFTGTVNVFEAMRECRMTQFVFGASSSVYGDSPVPFREDAAADRPLQPYAATKRACEMLAYTYSHLFGINATCTRFFTAYGPRLRPDLALHKFANLIWTEQELTIFGDGSAQRDFTYISDIVDGLIASIQRPFAYEIINLGNSNTITVKAMIDALEMRLGKTAKRVYLPPNPSDMDVTYADISKAKRLLGYQPKVPFEEGVRRFVEWFKEVNAPV
ncbi:MAG: SDR family NAD(P)-dependent oxidoreductase [Candidatus Poribacteria bacterium]|nr:SDR family NAD(P)-dependent oxidoreductase [Candidatus Poribacteria bacterium]